VERVTEENLRKVDELYTGLLKKIKRYHPSTRLSQVEKAYRFALDAHEEQLRASGEPYIVHPLSVAIILSELELDLESIAAGILHDVVEDTRYTQEDMVSQFGGEIALLVDGVTKLDKMTYTSKEDEQAENYRKMFLAMAADIRVILIKIADRLHNMRTLKYRPDDKQHKVAQETLDIYAPLAHRLGISKIRYELEDLSFKYLDREAYDELKIKIQFKQSEREAYINSLVRLVKKKMDDSGIKSTVEGRPKHFFSIYKKMVSKEKTLDEIYDLFAIRVIVDEPHDCYMVLAILHEMYKPIPGRFKDYIGFPKSNRYQSLHTTLIGPDGEPFEVQIRTFEMHRVAEYGIAAHWRYKEGVGGHTDADSEEAKLSWLRQVLDWQRDLEGNDFVDALKSDLNIFKSHVYCFTPKGEVISLTNGATPIDFAYAIHSAVGNKMVGARVNGRIVTFDYALKTGDRVEILTSQNSRGPGKDWLNLVKTSQARSKINQWIKRETRSDNVLHGKELLEAEAKKKNVSLTDLLADGREEIILNRFNCQDFDTLCAAVGYGGIREGQVVSRLFNEYQKTLPATGDEAIIQDLIQESVAADNRKKKSGIVVKGVGDSNVRFSKCCSPLPGDEIVGFITRGRGVSIHRSDCPNVINLEQIDRQRLIEADWQLPDKTQDSVLYHAYLRVLCEDRDGMVFEISRILRDVRVKVNSLDAHMNQESPVVYIGVEVSSRNQFEKLCADILKLPGAHEIERITS
jgi:GTP pyrophosphokinase